VICPICQQKVKKAEESHCYPTEYNQKITHFKCYYKNTKTPKTEKEQKSELLGNTEEETEKDI
jgi:uncharacterized Zn finger protein (UPF0148 family)